MTKQIYLCKAWGEVDFVELAVGLNKVRDFLAKQVLGNSECLPSYLLADYLLEIQKVFLKPSPDLKWGIEFRNGGVSVERVVFADTKLAPPASAVEPTPQPVAGDAELLNFLSQRGNVVIMSDDENNEWFVGLLGGTDAEVTVCRGVTLRIAIHAAIAAGGVQT